MNKGLMMFAIAFYALLVFLYGLISRRAKTAPVTAPMVFVAAGLMFGFVRSAELSLLRIDEALLAIGIVALTLTFFTDATRMSLSALRGNADLAGRLLAFGIPLTVGLGAVAAIVLFPQLTIWEAALLATVVTPSDAGLIEAIIENPRIPDRIRQTLNVESSLNDGMTTPFFALFLFLATTPSADLSSANVVRFAVVPIGLAVLVGATVGGAGAWLIKRATQAGWMTGMFQKLAVWALALICYGTSSAVGGNGFIAAFVGGLSAGVVFREIGATAVEFTEAGGRLLDLAVLFLLGVLIVPNLGAIDVRVIVYALLSLTFIRMVPVALALYRSHLQRPSILFLGWFGPRGLASVVLGLMVLNSAVQVPGLGTITLTVALTVVASVFAHGLTAYPLVNRYASWVETLKPGAPEFKPVIAVQTRSGAILGGTAETAQGL